MCVLKLRNANQSPFIHGSGRITVNSKLQAALWLSIMILSLLRGGNRTWSDVYTTSTILWTISSASRALVSSSRLGYEFKPNSWCLGQRIEGTGQFILGGFDPALLCSRNGQKLIKFEKQICLSFEELLNSTPGILKGNVVVLKFPQNINESRKNLSNGNDLVIFNLNRLKNFDLGLRLDESFTNPFY